MQVRRILCPLDFSDTGRIAVDHAAALAKTFGAEIVLLHIVEPVLYPVAYGLAVTAAVDLEQEAVRAAEAALATVAAEVEALGVLVVQRVDTGTPSHRVCDLAVELKADLVVMATHGLTGVRHLVIGSTTERVVRHCDVPVLTVKAKSDGGS